MKNLRKMTKLKSEKMRTALRAVALVLLMGANSVMLQAQNKPAGKNTREEDKGYYMNKDLNKEGNLLTLEAYVTGETFLTDGAADIALVLDVSGSMNTGTLSHDKTEYVNLFTRFNYYQITHGYTYQPNNGWYKEDTYNGDNDYKYWYKMDDALYEVIGVNSSNKQWLYFDNTSNGKRYYLKGIAVIETTDHTTPSDSYTPKDIHGNNIDPVLGNTTSTSPEIWRGELYTKIYSSSIQKMTALKMAVYDFIDVVAQMSKDKGVNHRISIVQFSGDYPSGGASISEKDPVAYFPSSEGSNKTMVLKNFTVVDEQGVADLKDAVSRMWAKGGTSCDKGVHLADMLNSTSNPSYITENAHSVVMFTDGKRDNGDIPNSVANTTLETSYGLKHAGVSVYSVGVYKNGDATDSEINFLSRVSSNYLNVHTWNEQATPDSDKYSFKAENPDQLKDIFSHIAHEVPVPDKKWNETTVVLDLISEYFQLPAGTNPSNIGVFTADCTGIDDSCKLVFGERVPMTNPAITVEGDAISVSNFNFSENWCGNHSATGTDYQGKKLIIEIPIEPAPNAPIGPHPTNGSGSGIYPNGEEHLVDSFPFPEYYIYGKTWVEHVTDDPGVEDINLVGDEYEIYSEEGLAWFISIVSGYNGMPGNSAAKAKLMADVDMSLVADVDMDPYLWVPIGGWGYCLNKQEGGNMGYSYPKAHGFSGTFDGQGHVIRGLNNIDPITMPQGGMFGNVNGGTVKNTFVIGCQVIGAVGDENHPGFNQMCTGTEGHFGIIADTLSNGGTIFNCEVEGTIMTYDTINNMYKKTPIDPLYENPEKAYIGGLVGLVTGESTVHSCISVASLLGYNMGGIAYQVEEGSKVQNCYSYALFNSWFPTIGSNLGGLVAVNNGEVQNCYLRNRADETKTVHKNLPEINFTGIYGAVDAAGKNNVRGTWHKGLLIGQNTGSATDIYVPEAWKDCHAKDTENNSVCFVGYESSNAAQNVGWFTDAVTPYLYQHNDTQVTMIGERETSGRLLQVLNSWANANDCTPWMRTTADGINNDYPVLKIDEFQYVAADNVAVIYGDDVNDVLDSRKLMTTGKGDDVIYLYKNAELTKANTGDDAATLYIDENVAVITQIEGLVNTAYVGITLDNSAGASGVNSDHGFDADAIDWHMFATSLSNAPLGINYNGDTQNWPFEYGHPEDMPYYSFYSESEQDGYFPSKTFGTDGTDGIDYYSDWDFYCWDEKYQHYINFKRNSNSHWYEGAPQQIAYTNESELVPGKGYMLAIANETFLQSHGTLNNGTVTRDVTYHENPFCPGYNLIGNPYQSYLDFDAFAELNGLDGYVILDEDKANLGFYVQYPKDGTVDPDLQYINMHQGFFIKVAGDQTLTFNNEMRKLTATANTHFRGEGKQAYPYLRLFVKEADGCGDYTTIEFNRPELGGGEKFMDLRTGNAQIYIHNGETNYSTLFATSDIDEVSVRFNTLEDGTFTLSWQLSEGHFNEMYLIDNINGQKTDMLTHNNYKFEGHAADYASRFNVVFHLDGDNNSESDVEPVESFAFQMGGNLIVNGMGTCQVFDLTGRLVSTNQLTDTQNTVALPQTAGIYMIRLVNGSSVKVQKLVVE